MVLSDFQTALELFQVYNSDAGLVLRTNPSANGAVPSSSTSLLPDDWLPDDMLYLSDLIKREKPKQKVVIWARSSYNISHRIMDRDSGK